MGQVLALNVIHLWDIQSGGPVIVCKLDLLVKSIVVGQWTGRDHSMENEVYIRSLHVMMVLVVLSHSVGFVPIKAHVHVHNHRSWSSYNVSEVEPTGRIYQLFRYFELEVSPALAEPADFVEGDFLDGACL